MFRRIASVRPSLVRSVSSVPATSADAALIEAEVLSGAPLELTARTARIYRPAKTAMQSGTAGMDYWKIEFDTQQRWSNELMGWASSADPVQALAVKFATKDDAVFFAQKQGWKFTVEEPKETKFKVRSYSSNFKVSARLTIVFRKEADLASYQVEPQ